MNTIGVQLKLTALKGGVLTFVSASRPERISSIFYIASRSEMSNFCSDQGRPREIGFAFHGAGTRVFGAADVCTPQLETRGERRAGQKGPFMDGHKLLDT